MSNFYSMQDINRVTETVNTSASRMFQTYVETASQLSFLPILGFEAFKTLYLNSYVTNKKGESAFNRKRFNEILYAYQLVYVWEIAKDRQEREDQKKAEAKAEAEAEAKKAKAKA